MQCGGRTVRICGALVTARAEAIRSELQEALASEEPVALDLSEVSAIDAMGVQLLLSACASAQSSGRALDFCAASASVLELCEAIGLTLPTTAGR